MRYLFAAGTTLLIGFYASALSKVDFEDQLAEAQKLERYSEGKVYLDETRRSWSPVNRSCLEEASRRKGGTRVDYRLVAKIEKTGRATQVQVDPIHYFSVCVAKWFVEQKHPSPPADLWSVYFEMHMVQWWTAYLCCTAKAPTQVVVNRAV